MGRGALLLTRMVYPPVANIIIYGIPLAAYLGAATLTALVITATFGFLVFRGSSKIPFSWHMNMARLTIFLAACHAVVVYLTFF